MVGSCCQSIKPDQAIGDWSSSLDRNGRGGLPCPASLTNSNRDQEAKRSRNYREVIEYWLSRGRVHREKLFYDRVEI